MTVLSPPNPLLTGDLLTRSEAADMVPPVAKRSSTISTRQPEPIAPSCTLQKMDLLLREGDENKTCKGLFFASHVSFNIIIGYIWEAAQSITSARSTVIAAEVAVKVMLSH